MNTLHKVKRYFLRADPDEVVAYRTVLPHDIHVSIKKDNDTFIAIIDKIGDATVKGLLITEAHDLPSLITTINDLLYSYMNIPENIRPYYGNLFKPEQDLQATNATELVLVKA